ncbi:septal ring lytic transglycosylase RlpA family protein [Notoacmeibacter sp. MSK16QG-6]|uniref:septal ring lytic transglycosylase RlpA family protein n=1 Tax=Notoacmeibacter sp. MSK16QG-6 TaxID=2957982 RepID=UPI00273A7312|nr:septal ring lytic transglycosylase RlpA family protein [Notoacmeibacter sp. MSK16QG-6]
MDRLSGLGTATALIFASGVLVACTSTPQASKSFSLPDNNAASASQKPDQSGDGDESGAEKMALLEDKEGEAGSALPLEQAFASPVAPALEKRTRLRRGGGSYKIGKPYKIKGRLYVPKDEPGYTRIGRASWYGPGFDGRMTANGEVFDQDALTAAHTTLPLPSYARVTNMRNGRSVVVRVNDRGPYAHDRVADLSKKAAVMLGFHRAGHTEIKLEYLGKAPLGGVDNQKLLASYSEDGAKPARLPGASIAVAMADQVRDGVEAVGAGVATLHKGAAKLLPGSEQEKESKTAPQHRERPVSRERFGHETAAHPLGYMAIPSWTPQNIFARILSTSSENR